jgi:hypothetical protein
MPIPVNDTQWHADLVESQKRKVSVSAIESERENAALAREILPGTMTEIDAEIEAAEAAHQAALNKKAAVESVAAQWDRLLDRKLSVERELLLGAQRFAGLNIDGRVEFIHAQLGMEDGPSNSLQRTTELSAWVAGAKEFRDVIYPAWRKAKEAELAKLMAEITEFARLNKIPLE